MNRSVTIVLTTALISAPGALAAPGITLISSLRGVNATLYDDFSNQISSGNTSFDDYSDGWGRTAPGGGYAELEGHVSQTSRYLPNQIEFHATAYANKYVPQYLIDGGANPHPVGNYIATAFTQLLLTFSVTEPTPMSWNFTGTPSATLTGTLDNSGFVAVDFSSASPVILEPGTYNLKLACSAYGGPYTPSSESTSFDAILSFGDVPAPATGCVFAPLAAFALRRRRR